MKISVKHVLKSNFQRAPADALLAVNAARAFFGLAGHFFGSLPADRGTMARVVSRRKGELIAAAANLAFSVELHLKAMAITARGHASHGHDLLELFDRLPTDLRDGIEKSYRYRCSCLTGKLPAIAFAITSSPEEPTAEQMRKWRVNSEAGDDVRSLLKAEKDAFRIWRYLHERHSPGEAFCVVVHHSRMAVLRDAIEDQSLPPHERPECRSGDANAGLRAS